MDMSEAFKDMEAHRDANFAIRLEDEVSCGMNLTNISVTNNGHQWRSLSLKRNELQKLIDALTAHIKETV